LASTLLYWRSSELWWHYGGMVWWLWMLLSSKWEGFIHLVLQSGSCGYDNWCLVTVKLAWGFPGLLLDVSSSLSLRDTSPSVSSTL
jgi:hypothetical protein